MFCRTWSCWLEHPLQINQMLWSVTVLTVLICCSGKNGFKHLFTVTVKALTSLRIFHQRSFTQRSLIRGRGRSIVWIYYSTVDVHKFRTLVACQTDQTNRVDSDQTASEEAVWSGSTLFYFLTSKLLITALNPNMRKVFDFLKHLLQYWKQGSFPVITMYYIIDRYPA